VEEEVILVLVILVVLEEAALADLDLMREVLAHQDKDMRVELQLLLIHMHPAVVAALVD
jgi:hypothetical protein